jgi:hypothetical protein
MWHLRNEYERGSLREPLHKEALLPPCALAHGLIIPNGSRPKGRIGLKLNGKSMNILLPCF